MSGSYLLDTNIIVDFFKGDLIIAQYLKKERFFISSIVAGELCFGAYASGLVKNRAKRLEEIGFLLEVNSVLEVDQNTSGYYGQIKSQLKRLGKPIPENDIWIAAQCRQYGLVLVTRDHHFQHINDFESIAW